ncbi:MAG: hypothetical protein QXH27_01445 [Candidatus Micrarchaeia archaeon]
MVLDRIGGFLRVIWEGHDTDVLLIELLNLFLIVLLVNRLLEFALRAQGRTLAVTLRYLAYAFVALGGAIVIGLMEPVGGIRWNLLFAFAQSVFIASAFFAINHLKESMAAYEHLLKRNKG